MDTVSCSALIPQPPRWPGRICVHPGCENPVGKKREICDECRDGECKHEHKAA
jgi:hypothetical protein